MRSTSWRSTAENSFPGTDSVPNRPQIWYERGRKFHEGTFDRCTSFATSSFTFSTKPFPPKVFCWNPSTLPHTLNQISTMRNTTLWSAPELDVDEPPWYDPGGTETPVVPRPPVLPASKHRRYACNAIKSHFTRSSFSFPVSSRSSRTCFSNGKIRLCNTRISSSTASASSLVILGSLPAAPFPPPCPSLALFCARPSFSDASSSSFRARSFSLKLHSGDESRAVACVYRLSANCASRKCARLSIRCICPCPGGTFREDGGSRSWPVRAATDAPFTPRTILACVSMTLFEDSVRVAPCHLEIKHAIS
mmetsp:Transcript_5413/g.20392  ORF Transcript_5413/g.20392 Transcript_5413/m.20392 type:complete len:307 (-) Transcript_5413:5457-6377(-)